MATTFLPPIVPSPFGKAFARKPYIFSDIGRNDLTGVSGYHYDYENSHPHASRAVSVPSSSYLSANTTNTSENAGQCFYRDGFSGSPIRRAHSLNAAHQSLQASPNGSPRPAEKPSEQNETFPIFEDPRPFMEQGFEDLPYYTGASRSSDQSWNWAPSHSANPSSAIDDVGNNSAAPRSVPFQEGEQEVEASSTTVLEKSLGRTAENFRRWASTFRRKRGEHRQEVDMGVAHTDLQTNTTSTPSRLPLQRRWHRKRTSNASSRFVATVQTASLSNDSISVLPRSHRYSRVSDTRGNRSSDPRSSADSQRPSSMSSSDEGALRRGIKRRQILQEVLSSEESYVADLKALHNLFATLLASIATMSTQTRNSIQRNVTEMLHLHEQIVNELHRVALRTTLREWKPAAYPSGGPRRRHRKWQSLDATSFHDSTSKHNPTAIRPDFAKLRSRGSSTHTADPTEVALVARIFRNHMARFFVYEEYCAKYEIMVQELVDSHKIIPQWSSYEAGMEALANSIASLNQRGNDNRKGLTAGDLLIKPIQRICKYPLLFLDLHKHTPVVDCPSSHAEVDGALNNFREMVREINLATDDPRVRERIQRRWLLQDRLKLGPDTLEASQFRMLGHVLLCGVLHVAYQTNNRVEGGYMLCMMFKDYLVVAAPVAGHAKFDILLTVYLSDAKVVSTEDGRGLQCHTALFSWKVLFESDSHLFELMFSACSSIEQQQWLAGIERGRSLLALEGPATQPSVPHLFTTTSLELKPLAPIFGQAGTLARRLSIQRAATVGPRVATCQVIIRNTHKPQDGQEMKPSLPAAINRSQSLLTTHRVTVLAPKRSERVRLEQSLANVWTRDTLPFPGMSLTRSGNIIRASAGSLVRKLSLASIHTPFAKRSTSLTLVGSRFSHDTSLETKHEIEHHVQHEPLSHEVILDDHDELGEGEKLSEEIVPPPSRLSFTAIEKLRWRSMKKGRRVSKAGTEPAPEISPEIEIVEDKLASKKRWSNPLGLLKNLSADGVRHLLYSSK